MMFFIFCASLYAEPAAVAAAQTGGAQVAVSRADYDADYAVPPGTRIRNIHIQRDDLFDSSKSAGYQELSLYDRQRYILAYPVIANAFHWLTLESTIRRDLLYTEGDVYRQDLIDESERILRDTKRLIVGATRVVPVTDEAPDNKTGWVDVYIYTQDVWSLYFNIDGKTSGGLFLFTFMFGERNLFGRGISAELGLNHDNFFTRWWLQFDQPRLLQSHWRFFGRTRFHYDTEGDHVGELVQLMLQRPLFSRSEKWGWQTMFTYENTPVIKHEGKDIKQVEVAPGVFRDRKYHNKYFTLENMLVRSFGYTNKLNIGAFIRNEQYVYHANPDLEPEYEEAFRQKAMKDDYTRHKAGVMLSANNHRWMRISGFRTFGRVEDFAQGSSLKMELSASQKFFGSDENAMYLAAHFTNNTISGGHIIQPRASFTSDFVAGAGQRNMIATLQYLHHIRTVPLGTLSFRAEATFGERLDADSYLSLGADTGLRGYVSDRFEGNRLVLFSAEYRFDPLPFIRNPYVSFVAFGDLGSCWYTGERSLKDIRLYPGAGIGIRASIPSINPDIIRFDIATNFGNDTTSLGSIFTFTYGHIF
jgi:hypothetical protein